MLAFCIQNISDLELRLGVCSLRPGATIDLIEKGIKPEDILKCRQLTIAFAKNRLIYVQKPNCVNHTLETLSTLSTPRTVTKLSIVDVETDYVIEPNQDLIVIHGDKDILIQLPSAENVGTSLYIKKYEENNAKITLRAQLQQKLDLYTNVSKL